MTDPQYLEIIQNGKRKKIKNGWIILRDEIKIDRDFLLQCWENKVPDLAVWNLVRKARKKRSPKRYALAVLKKLVGSGLLNEPKDPQTEEKGANRDEYYHSPHNS